MDTMSNTIWWGALITCSIAFFLSFVVIIISIKSNTNKSKIPLYFVLGMITFGGIINSITRLFF